MNKRYAWTAIVLAALALLPLAITGYHTSIATQILIYAALAMSIDISPSRIPRSVVFRTWLPITSTMDECVAIIKGAFEDIVKMKIEDIPRYNL